MQNPFSLPFTEDERRQLIQCLRDNHALLARLKAMARMYSEEKNAVSEQMKRNRALLHHYFPEQNHEDAVYKPPHRGDPGRRR